MTEVTILGSSGSSPAKGRHMPCVALRREGELFLFDCGEGTQMQMLEYGINSYKVRAIFVSHAHSDHIIGIAGLIRTLAMNNRKESLRIFVPKGEEGIIKNLLSFDRAMIGYAIEIVGVGSGIIYKGKGFSVSAFRLKHTIDSCGYVFKEDDRIKFIKGKCRSLGIKGEAFKELEKKGKIKIGKKTVSLSRVSFLQKGKKVVYAVDTRPMASTIKAAMGADLLMHESSYTEQQRDLAIERRHSTALEAAKIARKAGVKRLVLIHISTRYKTADPLIKEACKEFKNVEVAKDGDRIIV